MAQLILLVVAAAWLAVLIPPMLRSRVENRPNSSVTDFRRQLNKLQSTATPPRGAVRSLGRPLAASPLHRPAAPGRPGQPTFRSGVTPHPVGGHQITHVDDHGHGTTLAPRRAPARQLAPAGDGQRYRSHGDPTGGLRRPAQDPSGAHHRATQFHRESQRADTTGAAPRPQDARAQAKRRRANVLFGLVLAAACTLFLAATTSSTVMLYAFALSFLALCGYVYLLAQVSQREAGAYDGWLDRY